MVRVAGGAVAVIAGAAAFSGGEVRAAKTAGVMKLTDIDVGDFAGVPQNKIISMSFTQPVDASTVNPATIQIRAQNAKGTGFTIQIPGSLQVAGSVVRFLPRLPTHLHNPADPSGGYYPAGSIQDDASANAGLQPARNHMITVIGLPSISAVKSTTGRPLNKNYTARFTTAAATPKTDAFTTDTYQDDPPPAFSFSNPPDKVAVAVDQYARHGGTQDVPSAINVTVFGTKVPLSPSTIRQAGSVGLTMLARHDDPNFRKSVTGSPFLEQNFDTVRLTFVPRFPLPDVASYAMSVASKVLDLTEVYPFAPNADRLRLRLMYEFLVAARSLNPGTPWEELANPPPDLITDLRDPWPTTTAERGVLKKNLLTLGDTYKDEVDPRVMVLFTTRDELVTHSSLVINFLQSENFFDPVRSTADWDQTIPSAASAIFTASGGSAVLGDLKPVLNTTFSITSYPQGVLNFRSIVIPTGVTVTFTGATQPIQPNPAVNPPVVPAATPPATIKCLALQLDGQISTDGVAGMDGTQNGSGTTVSTTPTPSVPGGPGGGYGGYAPAYYSQVSNPSGTGGVGNDANLIPASAVNGGRGGLGGLSAPGTGYTMASGGGGGGGSRLAGTAGSNATMSASYQASYATWAGLGGQGGAGATGNSDLSTLVGGAGGGGGGNAQSYTTSPYFWGTAGAGGGGGAGALLVQTSGVLTIGNSGLIHSRGGKGGKGVTTSYTGGGGGGGGGGGAVLLRSSKGFNLANPAAAVDVSGGGGGSPTTTTYGTGGAGGTGGTGFIRFEDINGGIAVPGATQGSYLPVGGGVPSYVYSRFIDLGVDNAKIIDFNAADFIMTSGNDAIFIEVQFAIENPNVLGTALTTAIDAKENSNNIAQVSQWLPVRLLDSTSAGGSFSVPGNTSNDAVFPISAKVSPYAYRFMRVRITFQLDPTQTATSPLPFVDQMTLHYDFNF